ncbi:MAG: type IX secretion system outer membrane channel protein PorV [Candidatus Zixiibacteriota bacterium]
MEAVHPTREHVLRGGAALIFGCLLVLAPQNASGGNSGRTGTAGALELIIPTDARGAAMGGSVIADATGTEALFWNPAGAALVNGTELMVSHRQYIADISLDHLALAHNVGSFGVIGLSVKALTMGDEPVYTTQQPEGTGEMFSSSFVVVGLSYARSITDRLNFGVNGHYISEKIYNEAANGLAFDMGFIYRPSVGGMTLGVVVKNYGPKMAFDGPDFGQPVDFGNQNDGHEGRTQSASFELPSYIQFGAAWDPIETARQRVRMTGSFQSNNFSEDEFRVGSEWGLDDQFFLRGGYIASSQDSYLYGFSLGAGLQLPLGDTETSIDYTWAEAGVFESNHFFTLKLRF